MSTHAPPQPEVGAQVPSPPPPGSEQPQPQVIYVKSAGNGTAVTGLVFGIIALIFGLAMNLLFPVAIGGGIVAFILGAVGRSRANSNPVVGHRAMASWAMILGVLAIAAGGYGASQVNKAVNDLNQSTQQLQSYQPASITRRRSRR